MVLKNKTKSQIKPKNKNKTKPKIKQKQTQKQSQNVIVNIHETKKKPITRRRNNNKKEEINNTSSAVYAIPDNRAIDTLRGELNETKNKLLSIKNTPNMVNQREDIENINNNLRLLSEEGNEMFGDIYKRLGGVEGNRRNFTNQEEQKYFKPYITMGEIKRGRGRPKDSKNRPKEASEQESTRELRSSNIPTQNNNETKSPAIQINNPVEESAIREQLNKTPIKIKRKYTKKAKKETELTEGFIDEEKE